MRALTDCVSTQNMTTWKHAADDKHKLGATHIVHGVSPGSMWHDSKFTVLFKYI